MSLFIDGSGPEHDALRRHLAELSDLEAHGQPAYASRGTGSILCFVKFPETSSHDCNYSNPFHPVYKVRIPHDRLIGLGSPKITMMLEPARQQRIRKRFQAELQAFEGVKGVEDIQYVLDFTPPENDDAADLLTSLWLPASTKIWWTSGYYVPSHNVANGPFGTRRPMADKPVGAVLVWGHDDICTCHRCGNIFDLWGTKNQADNIPGIYPGPHVPEYRKIEDYCKVRHCMCILRILRAIAGEDLLINSATRMWTVAQLAIYLEIPNVVRDSITMWFTAQPNSKFIELYPEESFQLALGLQMADVLIASYKILVTERALELAAPSRSPNKPSLTWIGRKRGNYGDMPEDPIEHGAQAFADRMKARFDGLSLDRSGIREWDRLKYFGSLILQSADGVVQGPQTELLEAYNLLVGGLNEAFEEIVGLALLRHPNPTCDMVLCINSQRAHSVPDCDLPALSSLYGDMHDHQRICTPFFWTNLKICLPLFKVFKKRRVEGCTLSQLVDHFHGGLAKAVKLQHIRFDPDEVCRRFNDDKAYCGFDFDYEFSFPVFYDQLERYLDTTALDIMGLPLSLACSTRWNGDADVRDGIEFLVSDHLITNLDESELRFLPLWAGGNDDGTGGVFQPDLPPAVLGPTQPGPIYHTRHSDRSDTDGSTAGYTASTGSSFSDLGMDGLDLDNDDATTVAAASNEPQYSHTSTIPPRGVIAMSASLPSETFTDDGDVDYSEAMYAQPAEHQPLGQALAAYMEDDSDLQETGNGSDDENADMYDFDSDDDSDSADDDRVRSLGSFSLGSDDKDLKSV